MAKPIIKLVDTYKYTTDMIKAAIKAGFKHLGGNGFLCKNCGNKRSARKFTKNRGTMYGCNLCGARWGTLIKEDPKSVSKSAVDKYSELKVMHSGAGYYIGRSDKYGGPYSRESGYYGSHEAAEQALTNGFKVRDCAENNMAYETGNLPDIR